MNHMEYKLAIVWLIIEMKKRQKKGGEDEDLVGMRLACVGASSGY